MINFSFRSKDGVEILEMGNRKRFIGGKGENRLPVSPQTTKKNKLQKKHPYPLLGDV
jgi:hypothetical protein